jgi:proteasome lid subunit RPN8/RPN11
MSITVHTADHYESQRTPHPEAALPLRLPQSVLQAIETHGEQTYPHECCGILMGRVTDNGIEVADRIPAGNANVNSAHNRYDISPQDLIRAQREGRAKSLDIVGFYHSHPDHPAFWSATDLAEAHWFGCAYVITSIDGRSSGGINNAADIHASPKAHTTNSFLLTGTSEDDKSFTKQSISAS